MKVIIESTDVICTIEGRSARVWKGVSAGGKRVTLYVYALRMEDGENQEALNDLGAIQPPRISVDGVDIRYLP